MKYEGFRSVQVKILRRFKMPLLVIIAASHLTIFPQAMPAAEEARTAIELAPNERALVLAEMRGFLQSVQIITESLSVDDLPAAVVAARQAGTAAAAGVPDTLKAKLPMGFRKLGSATHRGFDELALDAEQLGDTDHALGQLSVLLSNCVACHAAFRIEAGQ